MRLSTDLYLAKVEVETKIVYCIGEGREWILDRRVLKKGTIGEGGRLWIDIENV